MLYMQKGFSTDNDNKKYHKVNDIIFTIQEHIEELLIVLVI